MSMDTVEVKNAVIRAAEITSADHGCLSVWLTLDYGGSGQGFGGYALFMPNHQNDDVAGLFIWRVMEIVGVSKWSELAGKTIRVKASHNKVQSIGNILLDKWFEPSYELAVAENVRHGNHPLQGIVQA